MLKVTAALLSLSLLGLAACDDASEGEKQAEAGQATMAAARRAAEEQVRNRLRIVGDMHLRAIQVYAQQIPDNYAVCGQINPSGGANDPFIPWVATMSVQNGRAGNASLVMGLSNLEASRVYLEMLDHCFDGGGPRSGQMAGVGGLPPLPSDTALTQQREPTPAPPSQPAPSGAMPAPAPAQIPQAPASGTITTTAAHPVNIRSSPAGGGAVVRVVPRASELRVFGEAPGGWLQVGEEQPIGWLHNSMVSR